MKTFTKDEFMDLIEWEGFEGAFDHAGPNIKILDDDLDQAYKSFASGLQDLRDVYDDWYAEQPDYE